MKTNKNYFSQLLILVLSILLLSSIFKQPIREIVQMQSSATLIRSEKGLFTLDLGNITNGMLSIIISDEAKNGNFNYFIGEDLMSFFPYKSGEVIKNW